MAVGFKVDFLWYQIGNSDFLHSFFSTICFNLENRKWGDKYPYIMKKLYQGKLLRTEIKKAKGELAHIKKELALFEPSKVIWDIDDLSKKPPWGNEISDDITSLANYFVTSDGRNLISILFEVFDVAEKEKIDIEIVDL